MSDSLRKPFGDQVEEKVTPDSQKSTTQKLSEGVSGTVDQAAAAIQPEGEKSTTQKLGDSTRGSSNDAESQGKGILGQAQDTLASGAQVVGDNLKAGADYVSGTAQDTKQAADDKTS